MQFRPIRPPFVLCFAADSSGCGYHRVVMPASALTAAGVIDARVDVRVWSEEWLRAVKPDVIVFQRQIELEQLDAIKTARRVLPNAFLVYEIDDAMSHVPEQSYHSGAVPPGVENRIREALAYCDAASTTTETLAEWLRSLGAKDVRVVPNYVTVDQIRERPERAASKHRLRIGWAGGASHDGDLALIVPTINEIGSEVDWVFFGAKPKGVRVPIEFHDAVSPSEYLAKLSSLDLDLVLAPLEHNFFNECKSNLRLIEAGACSAAVIAQAETPYVVNEPPVFSHVLKDGNWTAPIRKFMALPVSQRRQHGAAMRDWVLKHYTYEGNVDSRLAAWMPDLPTQFMPVSAGKSEAGKIVICSFNGESGINVPASMKVVSVETTIEDAAARAITTGADLLWLRVGTTVSDAAWQRMRQEIIQDEVASVCVLGPDGLDGFPTKERFTPVAVDLADRIADVVAEIWPNRVAELIVPSGAAVLIRSHMLGLLGSPDGVGLGGNVEAALAEWAIRVNMRRHKHIQILDQYVGCVAPPASLTDEVIARLKLKGVFGAMQGQVAALSARDREMLELRIVAQQWTGPRPGVAPYAADYETWAALTRNTPIRMAQDVTIAAFNGPLPSTEWVMWIDDMVTLKPGAAAILIEAAGTADFVYADHEQVTEKEVLPVFKPDFDYELFLARDYVTPVLLCRTSALRDGAANRDRLYQDVLYAARDNRELVRHVPIILGSVKDATASAMRISTNARARIVAYTEDGAIEHPLLPDAVKVMRVVNGSPKVTIVICTIGDGWMLQPCLLPLLKLTDYDNYDVIVVYNGPTVDIGPAILDSRVRCLKYDGEFNWSKINNYAVAGLESDYFLFLNDDTRLISHEWLSAMLATAQRPNVGVVGARLFSQQGTFQHIGVIAHKGLLGHAHLNLPANKPGYMGTAFLTHECAAVTGACMLVSSALFAEIGGFQEDLSHNYNDVAFCLDARRLGKFNVVEARAELIHLVGSSRPKHVTEEGMARLIAENAIMGARYMDEDRYWNPNYALMASGQGVVGLNYEFFAWKEETVEGKERVLVINDSGELDGLAAQLIREGVIVYMCETDGFELRMIAPTLVAGRWDVRDPVGFSDAIRALGISRIILSSLMGRFPAAPVETLGLLRSLDVPTIYVPRTPEVACPRLDLRQNGKDCGSGWKNGPAYCQNCVNAFGSPFGFIDVMAWQTAWRDILPVNEVQDAAD